MFCLILIIGLFSDVDGALAIRDVGVVRVLVFNFDIVFISGLGSISEIVFCFLNIDCGRVGGCALEVVFHGWHNILGEHECAGKQAKDNYDVVLPIMMYIWSIIVSSVIAIIIRVVVV
jgi:hypothetical protein